MPGSSDVRLISDSHPNQRVWLREAVVLIPLLCLMFLGGVTTTVEVAQVIWLNNRRVLSLWKLCNTIISVPSFYLWMFLSNYIGRKPVIIILFLFSILTSILHSISIEDTWLLLVFIVQGIFKGGTTITTFIAIWEYSSSKSKLKYLLANAGVWQTTEYFTKTVLYRGDVIENDTVYTRVLPVVLGLTCLIFTWIWPESPYWLASKGKVEDSRRAFLWLHGEESEQELKSLRETPQSPGPPKLFGLSLFLIVLTDSLYKITVWYKSSTAVSTSSDFISKEFKTGLLVCSSALFVVYCTGVMVNHVKRKVVLLTSLGLAAVFYIFRYLGEPIAVELNTSLIYTFNSVTRQLEKSGPLVFCLTVAIWQVPEKYRPFAYAIHSSICLGISAMILILAINMSYS